ncbi:uncharacterized protein LOC131325347 [Rhododendron vialii]|uniref:uncharacterized protein LOC131325347 n=1 Tax=Rhododendron vialii TaxID=182163 RepID=UPI00265F23CC|nr:uncharacterized protein LOC131325347 [Rhododendron vialii]
MALALPRFAVFQSTSVPLQKKYLRYIHEGGGVHGLLQFSGEEIVSPYSKFEIERAKTTAAAGNDNGFVHIRCCYNNKYWVAGADSLIVAGADEPNEDQSQRSCTLFEPIPVYGEGRSTGRTTKTTVHVLFRHVQGGDYYLRPMMTRDQYHDRQFEQQQSTSTGFAAFLCLLVQPVDYLILMAKGDRYHSCLISQADHRRSLTRTTQSTSDVFGIIDWESLLILPKHIALKGDNGQYLSARWIEGHQYLKFASGDNGDPTVGNEVFITKDGNVRIKNNHFGKFWRRSPNWIWADSNDTTTNNSDTLFSPVKVGNNVVALRNLGNNNFCKRLTTEGKTSCLNAAVTTISREARLVVEELVISRNIDNFKFRLLDARIYNQNIITMVTKTATNNTQVSNTATLKLLRKETRSTTWNGSVSLKLGVKTIIRTGIPLIAKGRVEVSAEFTGKYEWGETVSTENAVETEYTITVLPMSKVTVSLLATQGSCDVPFSYTQHDMLMDGKQVIYNLDDGVYTGINSFNFFYETKQEKLGYGECGTVQGRGLVEEPIKKQTGLVEEPMEEETDQVEGWCERLFGFFFKERIRERKHHKLHHRLHLLAAATSESTVKQLKKNENKNPDRSPNEPTVSEQSSL